MQNVCIVNEKGKILYAIENSKFEKVHPYTKQSRISHGMQELVKACEL